VTTSAGSVRPKRRRGYDSGLRASGGGRWGVLNNSPSKSSKTTTSARGSNPCRSTPSGETLEEKAARYLREGRVTVRVIADDRVEAEVRGSEKYKTIREGKRWACDCPAWQRRCSDVIAVELVT
jgi:hypothetical protein